MAYRKVGGRCQRLSFGAEGRTFAVREASGSGKRLHDMVLGLCSLTLPT